MYEGLSEFLEEHKTRRHELKELQKDESILTENKRRFVLFPIKYHEIYDAYKKREALFWTAEELDFSKDIQNWNDDKITKDEKEYFIRLLALFASNDMDRENLTEHLSAECQTPEAKCFYGFQIMVDNIHQEVYGILIDSLVKDDEKRTSMFEEIKDLTNIKEKIEYAKSWFENEDNLFGEKLIAEAAVLGIFSLSAYVSVLSFQKGGLIPGFVTGVDNMLRDRGLHVDFCCLMYAHLKNQIDSEIVQKIIVDAVEIEKKSLLKALPIIKVNLKIDEMNQFIEYVADSILVAFGNEKHYNATNPYEFMENVVLPGNTNSLAKTIADAQKASEFAKTSKPDAETTTFSFNEDF
ncbi:hypothetical protein Kpol_2002p84 [Vanderwaltozyma polyspora DSM 70294]|uniref:Uncharacterized protein n=1 Tax=Vanderwaltozyma polyspora (strain ATCC 22028 / DSM 70294 / BCRC 21397 / CBS 2163 / NBRC 10782 / NRRL Y-8283 / UCD 57-17) TaxID=436907 RepID=A7TFJ9_VANPO|nr:uncharacterized protein Kpol_2002p84 [Vanderwaltozyma polyspora DSM 70294]EDO19013.1 hypothetical protein Kpol_2002p84 [Vanderwaltozyma polyspora DSM 70294]